MKKFFIAFSILFLISGTAVFAQSDTESKQAFGLLEKTPPATMQTIVPEKQHLTKLNGKEPTAGKVFLEYIPITGEVWFYYSCTASSFDPGDALATALAIYEDFSKDYQYSRYKHMQKDKTRYYKDEKGLLMAEYRSYVVFSR